MMVTRVTLTLTILTVLIQLGDIQSVSAQTNVQRVRPIVLTSSPSCCTSPATTSRLVPLPCGDCTHLQPADRDPLRVVPTSSQLRPLPAQQPVLTSAPQPLNNVVAPQPLGTTVRPWRGTETPTTTPTMTVTGYPETVTSMPATMTTIPPATTDVRVLRPTVPVMVEIPKVRVPEGYVVGKGLVGQPKLYKPGQPVRNFLRYITL